MINRLTEYFGAPGVPPPPESYWFIYRRAGGGWTVSALEECTHDQRARARAFWQKIQGEGEDPTPCF